jgi:endonuclease/exonuclease/phosphatase family metal-dependent hydrolase
VRKKLIFLLFFYACLLKGQTLTVATYNTGLADMFDVQAEGRLKTMIESLKALDVDILCLQEIYDKKIRERFLTHLGPKFSDYFHSSLSNVSFKSPACSLRDLLDPNGAFYCRFKNCLRMRGTTLRTCLEKNCDSFFKSLKSYNAHCAQAQIVQEDVNILEAFIRLGNPFFGVNKFVKAGGDGLLLFSKRPILSKTALDFTEISTYRRKGGLMVEVSLGQKRLNLICSHLSSNREVEASYGGILESWERENAIQLKKLSLRIPENLPIILLGNLGCSRSFKKGNIQANLSDNCAPLDRKDMIEPVYQWIPECTFCPYNNLMKFKAAGGLILDHILIKKLKVKEMALILDDSMEINPGSKDLELTFLSDHFGLKATLEVKED